MKKAGRLFVFVTLAAMMAACATPAAAPPAAAPAATEAPAQPEAAAPLRLVLIRVTGDPFYKTVECGAMDEATSKGATLEVQGLANFDIAEQTRVIDAVIATKPDAIITAPVDPTGMAPAIERIREAGIPIVTYDTRLTETSLSDAEVITDNFEQGVMSAQALAAAIDDAGKVFVLSDMPGIYTTGEEQRGFEEEIAKHPNIEYLGTQYHNNDQNNAVSITKAVITANPDLKGIFATNTFGSLAVATALKELDLVGKVMVVAYDTPTEVLQALRDGVFTAVMAYEARKEGVLAVDAAIGLAKGETVKALQTVGNRLLTAENVDAAENQDLIYVNECK